MYGLGLRKTVVHYLKYAWGWGYLRIGDISEGIYYIVLYAAGAAAAHGPGCSRSAQQHRLAVYSAGHAYKTE